MGNARCRDKIANFVWDNVTKHDIYTYFEAAKQKIYSDFVNDIFRVVDKEQDIDNHGAVCMSDTFGVPANPDLPYGHSFKHSVWP